VRELARHPSRIRGGDRRRDGVDEQDRQHEHPLLHGVRRAGRELPAAAVRTTPDGLVPQLHRGQPRQRLLGEQLAAQYGVQPASGYQQAVTQYQQALASSPPDEREAAIEVAGADAYLQNVQVAIGQQLTGNFGQSNADLKAALARGKVATQDWLDDHEASIDPVFGISVDDGAFTAQREQTSYPLSTFASQGAQPQPDSDFVSALPAAQRCG
jgi:hypothetical protein